jgi:hypothetical protein
LKSASGMGEALTRPARPRKAKPIKYLMQAFMLAVLGVLERG